MLASSIPIKFPIPWGNSAGSSYIRPISVTSLIGISNGAASLPDGFPPLDFVSSTAGGSYVDGRDMNGILNQLSAWARWQNAGVAVPWDSTFSAGIGGYPQGSTVMSTVTLGLFWFSIADNNTSNPDAGGANWISFSVYGDVTRIITLSGAFVTSPNDGKIGLNRTTSVAVSNTTLPSTAQIGKKIIYEDLAANFNDFPLSVVAPAGMTIAGIAPPTPVVLNVNRQSVAFTFYGSNVWSGTLWT